MRAWGLSAPPHAPTGPRAHPQALALPTLTEKEEGPESDKWGWQHLLAELLDSPPALDEVLKELALPLQVARSEQPQVHHQVV